MVDPTSDLNEGLSPEDCPTCATCDEPIVENPNHRVITWVEDNTVQSVHFCDEDCRLDWDGDE